MKGEPRCYKHEQEAELEARRQSVRQRFVLPELTDSRTVQRTISEVAKAIIDNRIDEEYAGELLDRLQRASLALRSAGM